MIEISGAISGLSATVQALKAAVAARDEGKINDAISDLKERLFDVQSANLQAVEQLHAAQTKIHALVAELDQLKAKAVERELYVPHNLAQGTASFFAYRYQGNERARDGSPVPLHYLCQPCFDNGRKSILLVGTGEAFCPSCKLRAALQPGKGRERISAGID